VTDLEQAAKNITAVLPDVKSGPMRLWGRLQGRLGEEHRALIGCEADGNCLRLLFPDDEILAVWNPTDIRIDSVLFRIGSATEMRLTYYADDGPRTPETVLYREYSLHSGLVAFQTNVDEVPESGWLPEETADSFPAVEIGE
jgi:hypothetical protein